jgi:RNA polymerase sigma factor (sigma-70 family)
MEDPEINDAALDEIIYRAINRDQEALEKLMVCWWMVQLLNRLADWASRNKKIDADENGKDIQDIIADRIRLKIDTVKNPRKRPWRNCLKSWCYQVAKTCCGTVRKSKQRLEQRYRVEVEHEHTQRIENRRRIVAPISPMMVSEQEEIEQQQQKQDSLRKKLNSKIHRTVRQAVNSFTPEDERILSLWAKGNTLKQISEQVEIPLPTVGRRLKKLQRAIIEGIGKARGKDIGVEQKLKKLSAHRAGFEELIAHSLRNMA